MEAQVGNLEEDSASASLTSLRASGARAKEDEDCGDFGMRIDRNGTWYYRGSPIGRKPMVKLFSTVLNRREAGTYWLTTPVENGRIEVDDVPYIAVELTCTGQGSDQIIDFRTNLDAVVPLGPDHALRVEIDPDSGEPSPYVDTGKNLDARLARSVFYHLVDLGVDDETEDGPRFGVWSRGLFFPIGDTTE